MRLTGRMWTRYRRIVTLSAWLPHQTLAHVISLDRRPGVSQAWLRRFQGIGIE